MASTSIRIVGVDRLLAKFKNLGEIDMSDAVAKAISPVQGTAIATAPVKDGHLKGSIKKQVKRKVTGTVEGKVYTNLEYAPYVEFGTGAKGSGTYPFTIKGKSLSYRTTPWAFPNPDDPTEMIFTNGQVAQPFMFPALKNNESKVKKILEKEYTSELAKAVK